MTLTIVEITAKVSLVIKPLLQQYSRIKNTIEIVIAIGNGQNHSGERMNRVATAIHLIAEIS